LSVGKAGIRNMTQALFGPFKERGVKAGSTAYRRGGAKPYQSAEA
jgi:hypothetical protein